MTLLSVLLQNPSAGAGGTTGFMLMMGAIFVVMYFFMFRPQQKKMKQHREMIAAVRRGDRVLTGGGIVGTVTKVLNDTELQVEIAEGVRVKVARATISEVLAKTEPAKSGGGEDQEEAEGEETPKVKGRSAKG